MQEMEMTTYLTCEHCGNKYEECTNCLKCLNGIQSVEQEEKQFLDQCAIALIGRKFEGMGVITAEEAFHMAMDALEGRRILHKELFN